jgi:hypothetical protein
MNRLTSVLCAAAWFALAATPAQADYDVVRWGDGTCQVWNNGGGAPWGSEWRRVAIGMPTWGDALDVLDQMYREGRCRR